MKPFVGITGVTKKSEIEELVDCLVPNSPRKLMIGVKINDNTFSGRKGNNLTNIWVKDEQVINVVDFYSYDLVNYFDKLADAIYLTGYELCDAVKLNMFLPRYSELLKFKNDFPDKKIILQIDRKILEQEEYNSPDKIVRKFIRLYYGLVDCIVLKYNDEYSDELNVDFILPFVEAFRRAVPDVLLAVGDGLTANNMGKLINPVFDIYADLSICAGDLLCDRNGSLSIIKAKNLLREATPLFDK